MGDSHAVYLQRPRQCLSQASVKSKRFRLTSVTVPTSYHLSARAARSNQVQLSGNSSSSEVKHWLQAQGFSPLTVDSLGALNGSQILGLTKQDLTKVVSQALFFIEHLTVSLSSTCFYRNTFKLLRLQVESLFSPLVLNGFSFTKSLRIMIQHTRIVL